MIQKASLLLFYSVWCFYHIYSSEDSAALFLRFHTFVSISWIESLFVCFLSCRTAAAGRSSDKDAQVQSHCEQLLLGVQKDLESQKDQVSKAEQDLRMQREQVKVFRAQSFIIFSTDSFLALNSGGISISLCFSELECSG